MPLLQPPPRLPFQLASATGVRAVPECETAFRRAILGSHGTYVAAWRRLFDRPGRGFVGFDGFRAGCEALDLPRDFDAAEAFALLTAGDHASDDAPEVLLFRDLDPEAGDALQYLAEFVRDRCASAPSAADVFCSHRGAAKRRDLRLDFRAFMRSCLDMGVETPNFRYLFDCLDYRGLGVLTAADLAVLDRWLAQPPIAASPEERLLAALERRAPVDEIVELVRAGADPNVQPRLPGAASVAGMGTALLQACERGTMTHLESLLQMRADPRQPNDYGQTALHLVAARPMSGRVDLTAFAALLVAARADLDARLPDGSTPLHLACSGGNSRVVATLCYLRADVQPLDAQSRSPLFFAVFRSSVPCVVQLLESSADPRLPDRNGQSVLEWCHESGRLEIMELLQQHLFDLKQQAQRGLDHEWNVDYDADAPTLLPADLGKARSGRGRTGDYNADVFSVSGKHGFSTAGRRSGSWAPSGVGGRLLR